VERLGKLMAADDIVLVESNAEQRERDASLLNDPR